MPLLIALIEFMIGAAVLVALAMFVLPIFFFVLGLIALLVIGVGIYRTYFAPPSQQDGADFSPFARGFTSRRPTDESEQSTTTTTVIEGEYTVVDDDKK